jgi:CspA family cold shock protein
MAKQTGTTSSGTVKWFDADKGFGFIAIDGETRDIFCHASQLVDPDWVPEKTDRVTFVPDQGRDGRPYARQITRA